MNAIVNNFAADITTFTPLEYLKIDIASNFGLDKALWQERLDWFAEHESQLEEMIALHSVNPFAIRKHELMKQADSPALFFAGIQAWGKARKGEATGYPISLDATASGAQLLSCLARCRQSASLCNVVPTGRREDLYTNVFRFMQDDLESLAEAISKSTGVTRDQAKQAVMTSLYGSKAEPENVFGKDTIELETFYRIMEEKLPGVWTLNEALLTLWNPTTLSHDWVLPDNFHVKTKVMDKVGRTIEFQGEEIEIEWRVNQPVEFGLELGANTVHSLDGMVVREMGRRCNYDPEKMEKLIHLLRDPAVLRPNTRSRNHEIVATLWSHYEESGFLSARILEVLDADNIHLVDRDRILALVATLPLKPFPMLAIHD